MIRLTHNNLIDRRFKHGNSSSNTTWTPEYVSWRRMLDRVSNPNLKEFKNYGGRGITVCDRWHKFENFLSDMGPRPEGMTLDRRNNNGNYEPGNCRWATRSQQAINKRMPKNTSSGVTGVTRRKYGWQASFRRNYVTTYLGTFDTIEEAAAARSRALFEIGEHHGI